MLKSKFFICSILSGIFIGTSFIPFPPWASIFAFVPLWNYWLGESSAKKIFWSGWLTQFILTLIGFNWIIITIHDFGGMPWPVAALGLLAFCSFATIYIPIAGLLFAFIKKKIKLSSLQSLILVASLLAILEPIIKTIFPWNFGYTLMTLPIPLYQVAEWIGFEGLSTVIIFANIILYCMVFPVSKNINKLTGALTVLILFSTLTLCGYYLENNLPETDKNLKVGIVQANIGNLDEQFKIHGKSFRDKIINKYIELTKIETAKNNPDVIVWPETAAPTKLGPNVNNFYNRRLKRSLVTNDISLITGTYTKASTGQTSNSVVFIDKGQFVEPSYSKTHLLAFGEYIPGSQYYPVVKTWLPQISDFKPGEGPQITLFKDVKYGIQICYESLFPKFSAKLANLGSEVIVNVTNDSWYGTYMEPYQHMYMTLARAIEVRRPLIRSTNTGISTVILADGTILDKSPISKVWSHTFDVPYSSEPKSTFYSRYPNLGLYIKLFILFLILFLAIKQRTKHE